MIQAIMHLRKWVSVEMGINVLIIMSDVRDSVPELDCLYLDYFRDIID